jgi:hypothetical protein
LRSSTSKQRERESGKVYVRNYIRKGEKQASPIVQSSPEHLEDKPMPNAMQVDKTPKLKTSKQRRNKYASPDIIAAEFVSLDTQIEEPPVEK